MRINEIRKKENNFGREYEESLLYYLGSGFLKLQDHEQLSRCSRFNICTRNQEFALQSKKYQCQAQQEAICPFYLINQTRVENTWTDPDWNVDYHAHWRKFTYLHRLSAS